MREGAGPTVLGTGVASHRPAPAELLAKVRRIHIRTTRAVSALFAGQYHSAFRGRGMEFEEVRPYQPGDDVRSIDWNVTARQGEPFIKTFREERELTVLLVADVSGSMAFGSRAQLKRDLAAELAATLAVSAFRNGDKAGLLCFSDRVELSVPPRKGPRHALRLIRELLALRPAGRKTHLAGALEHLQKTQRRRAVTFVISDFVTPGYEHALSVVSRRHDVVAVTLADPLECSLPPAGLLETVDPETGQRTLVDTSSAKVRRWHADAWRAATERRQALFRRLALDSLDLVTGQSVVEPLARLFHRREARMGR